MPFELLKTQYYWIMNDLFSKYFDLYVVTVACLVGIRNKYLIFSRYSEGNFQIFKMISLIFFMTIL